jgi:hypothetical protein
MTRCISAEVAGASPGRWGTLVDMTGMNKLRDGTGGPGTNSLNVLPDEEERSGTVVVPAGRTFFSVARELEKKGWVFRVNTELGTLTMGAAACGATKDSSFPGESGQVCADVVGMRLIRPDGTAKDYSENDAKDLEVLRCSYGLFGIVTEVTYRVYPLEYISIEHDKIKPVNSERFAPDELRKHFRAWLEKDETGNDKNAVFLYMFPYRDRIVAELRRKPAHGDGKAEQRSARLLIRNLFWEKGAHKVDKFARKLKVPDLTHNVQNLFDKILQESFAHVLRLKKVNPVAQIVDFDKNDRKHRFTFSMWAFPEDEFPEILPQYFELCKKHETTFRTGLPHASYHIGKDRSSLLSYSSEGPVWTLDPICPENVEGWEPFLHEFNSFCSERGGVPLLNQTPYLTRELVRRAFADRLTVFEAARRRFDPGARMLNDYFAEFLRS